MLNIVKNKDIVFFSMILMKAKAPAGFRFREPLYVFYFLRKLFNNFSHFPYFRGRFSGMVPLQGILPTLCNSNFMNRLRTFT